MAIKNFVSTLRSMWNGTYADYNDIVIPGIITGKNIEFDPRNADTISTVYTCVKVLSDTLSRLPLNVYTDKGEGRTIDKEDYRYPMLHYTPNNYTSQQTFFATLEYWRNLTGNAYARIWRDSNGRPLYLTLLPPSKVVSYSVENNELYYIIKENEVEIKLNSVDLLHFKTLTRDGILGISPLTALRLNLSSSFQGLNTINSFYKNNALSPKALKSTISNVNQKAMVEAMQDFKTKYTGSSNAGTWTIMPPNTELVDMSISLADAELINTLKFNTTQIASLYGVPSWMVGILESTKFSSVELMALEFRSTTIAPIARAYRQELESKLLTTQERLSGMSIEFNTMAMIEMDSVARNNNYKTLFGLGVMSPNDIARLEGFPVYESGNERFLPGNYLTVDKVVKSPYAGTPAFKAVKDDKEDKEEDKT